MNAALRQPNVVGWSHPSVSALMGLSVANETPDDVIKRRCRELVADAKSQGWTGPPYDPEILASLLDIAVERVEDDIRADARIFPGEDRRLVIQCASSASPERQRFSICHEIAHTRFPDCYEEVRCRLKRGKLDKKHLELERLCNIGAGELLIPHDDFRNVVRGRGVTIELAEEVRQTFACSIEAGLYRLVDLTDEKCAVAFLSKRLKPREERRNHPEFNFGLPQPTPKYRVDYVRASRRFSAFFPPHKSAPDSSVVYHAVPSVFPSAMERWDVAGLEEVSVQACVLPPIPGQQERVAAVLRLC